jgi:uncharacterized protein YegP (UPF0339 family)
VNDLSVHIFRSKTASSQPWFVRLVGGNGEPMTRSEGYYSKWNAKRAARRMFPGVPLWETAPDGSGQARLA